MRPLLLACLLGCASDPAGSADCTLIGCASAATIKLAVTAGDASLRRLTLEMCRNEVCARASLELPEGNGARDNPLTGALSASATVYRDAPGKFRIEARVRGAGAYPYGLVDGDRYELRLLDGATRITTAGATLTFSEHYPNGRACDAHPCRNAEHDGGGVLIDAI